MEKPSFVRNGEMKLPIGFRFHPTDEELFIHYLKRKALCFPLPASVIPELDVFQTDPSGLPGDLKEKRYFFGKRNGNEKRSCRRACGSGYWKAIGKDKQIMSSQTNQPVGLKRKMVFYQGKLPNVTRTNWIMWEYRLIPSQIIPNFSKKSVMEMEDNWVIYSVSQNRKPQTKGITSQICKPNKFLNTELVTNDKLGHADQFQECSSSGITEISCDGNSDQEEICSTKNSSSHHFRA